jgi:hypothetical protein
MISDFKWRQINKSKIGWWKVKGKKIKNRSVEKIKNRLLSYTIKAGKASTQR